MENRNGLVVQAELTRADDHAERKAALDMLDRHSPGPTRCLTLGADKGYDSADFVAALRRMVVTPHIAQKSRHFAIGGCTTHHPGYSLSQRRRKNIEEPFGWAETVGGMAQTVHRGLARVDARFTMTMAPAISQDYRNSWRPDGEDDPRKGLPFMNDGPSPLGPQGKRPHRQTSSAAR